NQCKRLSFESLFPARFQSDRVVGRKVSRCFVGGRAHHRAGCDRPAVDSYPDHVPHHLIGCQRLVSPTWPYYKPFLSALYGWAGEAESRARPRDYRYCDHPFPVKPAAEEDLVARGLAHGSPAPCSPRDTGVSYFAPLRENC